MRAPLRAVVAHCRRLSHVACVRSVARLAGLHMGPHPSVLEVKMQPPVSCSSGRERCAAHAPPTTSSTAWPPPPHPAQTANAPTARLSGLAAATHGPAGRHRSGGGAQPQGPLRSGALPSAAGSAAPRPGTAAGAGEQYSRRGGGSSKQQRRPRPASKRRQFAAAPPPPVAASHPAALRLLWRAGCSSERERERQVAWQLGRTHSWWAARCQAVRQWREGPSSEAYQPGSAVARGTAPWPPTTHHPLQLGGGRSSSPARRAHLLRASGPGCQQACPPGTAPTPPPHTRCSMARSGRGGRSSCICGATAQADQAARLGSSSRDARPARGGGRRGFGARPFAPLWESASRTFELQRGRRCAIIQRADGQAPPPAAPSPAQVG